MSPTNYYHIMMHGNNREKIFIKENQKIYFIELLKNLERNAIEIVAYCLMDNHVHIVVKGEIEDLSTAILDRILHKSEVVNLDGDSYRIAHRETIFGNN